MKRLIVENFAQIEKADLTFGDFTVFIGPQASGKSILLQLMKLILDNYRIRKTLKQYGFNWESNENFLRLFFGEGMDKIISKQTKIIEDEKKIIVEDILRQRKNKKEEVFLIPAQRVLTIQSGWPRNFQNYEAADPYVVKHFSESLRILMEAGLGRGTGSSIFPQEGRMKKAFRDKLNESIFFNAQINLDKSSPRKRFLLNIEGHNLPYMVWSAGQREFMPLLLGLYWLMPPKKISKREGINWVIIEEPEMGLHPKAIAALLLTFLELLSRGYKVIISTHSSIILELCWVIVNLKEKKKGPDLLFDLFDLPKQPTVRKVFENVLKESATIKSYYFKRENDGVTVKDISLLDPFVEEAELADWGGLTSFSSKASEIISNLHSS